MTMLSIGDLAHSFLIRRQTAGLKADLTRLGTELTTGRKADLSQVLAGDYGPYAGIERALRAVAAFETANTEAAGMMAAAQLALENVQDIGRDVTPALLTASSSRSCSGVSDAPYTICHRTWGAYKRLRRSMVAATPRYCATTAPALWVVASGRLQVSTPLPLIGPAVSVGGSAGCQNRSKDCAASGSQMR